MKKILIITIAFCISLYPKININDDMGHFNHIDQFDKTHNITNDTKTLLFSFKKKSSHIINDFLETKNANYLKNKNALYIVNVSSMPTIIKWFVLPFLTNYDFPIIALDDEGLANRYQNEDKIEDIMIVSLHNKKVSKIIYINTKKELEEILNNK